MGKKSPKAPAAPDPVATAQAQAAMNKETAIASAATTNMDHWSRLRSMSQRAARDASVLFRMQ